MLIPNIKTIVKLCTPSSLLAFQDHLQILQLHITGSPRQNEVHVVQFL